MKTRGVEFGRVKAGGELPAGLHGNFAMGFDAKVGGRGEFDLRYAIGLA